MLIKIKMTKMLEIGDFNKDTRQKTSIKKIQKRDTIDSLYLLHDAREMVFNGLKSGIF